MGWKLVIGVILIIGAIVAGIFYFNSSPDSGASSLNKPVEEASPKRVETSQEKLRDLEKVASSNGTTSPERFVYLKEESFQDSVVLAKNGQHLNLNESVLESFGPRVFESSLNHFLKKGSFYTKTGRTISYEQRIDLSSVMYFREVKNSDFFNDSETYYGFIIEADTDFLGYSLGFVQDTKWSDLVGAYLPFFGEEYYVVEALSNSLQLRMFAKAYSFDIREGETVTVSHPQLGQHSFYVKRIDEDGFQMEIDGVGTIEYEEGEEYFEQDMYFYVDEVSYSELKAGLVSITISPEVFFLSLDEITSGNETYKGLSAGFSPTSGVELDSITLSWQIENDTFVTQSTPITIPYFNNLEMTFSKLYYEESGPIYTNVTLMGITEKLVEIG